MICPHEHWSVNIPGTYQSKFLIQNLVFFSLFQAVWVGQSNWDIFAIHSDISPAVLFKNIMWRASKTPEPGFFFSDWTKSLKGTYIYYSERSYPIHRKGLPPFYVLLSELPLSEDAFWPPLHSSQCISSCDRYSLASSILYLFSIWRTFCLLSGFLKSSPSFGLLYGDDKSKQKPSLLF